MSISCAGLARFFKSSDERPRADAAEPLAVDDGHDGWRAVGDERNGIAAADRPGDGRDILVRRGEKLLDGIIARRQSADDQRFIQLGTAARAEGEDRAIRVAGSGDTQGEGLRRTALVAAGLQNDLMNDQRRTVFKAGAAIAGRVAAQRVHPFGIGAAGSA